MHGITKELEKLTRASAQLVADPEQNPFRPDQSEHAYFDALKRKAAQDGYRTRVVVDIISGTSAGGINGVCLAKSLRARRAAGRPARPLADARARS